jgi:enoyl-CoA hydratase/carnithine racemase
MPIRDSGGIPEVDIGHLSRKIDTIITETIYEGAGMSLEDGLDFEARQFGRCMKTEDMKIGLKNFLTNGPRVKAKFVHK